MTIEELHNKLVELGISESMYYLHGIYGSNSDRDKIALSINRGKYFREYEVYFRERNEKSSVKIFTNETEACEYIFRKLQTL